MCVNMNSYMRDILASLSKVLNRDISSETLLPADAVAALLTSSAELTLRADVGAAQRTCPPPKLPLPADVVATKSSRPKMKIAVSGGRRQATGRVVYRFSHRREA